MKRFWLATVATILAVSCSDSASDDDDDDDSSSDQCPAVCEKLNTVFANEGCPAPTECNCKEPCADLTNAAVDCLLAAPGICACQGNELDCGTACQTEIDADNACWQAN